MSGFLLDTNVPSESLRPRPDANVAGFLPRITLTHTQRDHAQIRTVGYGPIYQGRYKH